MVFFFFTISAIIFSKLSFKDFFTISVIQLGWWHSYLTFLLDTYFEKRLIKFLLGVQLFHLLKGFESFIPIKLWYCFYNIFNTCLNVIPNFTNIYWWQGYVNINLVLYDIVLAFVKNGNINSILCEQILVVKKIRSMHEEELLITWVDLSIIDFYPVDIVFPSFWASSIKISSYIWTFFILFMLQVKIYFYFTIYFVTQISLQSVRSILVSDDSDDSKQWNKN